MNSEIKNCGDFGLKEGFQLRHILGLSGIYFDAVVEYLSQSFHFYSGWIWPYYSAPFYHDILLLENELGVKKIQILSKKKNVGEEFQNSPFNIKNLIETFNFSARKMHYTTSKFRGFHSAFVFLVFGKALWAI